MSLEEPLIAVPAEPQLISVVAPADLMEGYTFDATVNGKVVSVTVPEGGVNEGQTFTVPYPNSQLSISKAEPLSIPPPHTSVAEVTVGHNIPTGRWRDGLCDFCSLGCCHPSLCCATWFPTIGVAQVMTRLKLTITGTPKSPHEPPPKTFRNIAIVTLIYLALNIAFNSYLSTEVKMDKDDDHRDEALSHQHSYNFYAFQIDVDEHHHASFKKPKFESEEAEAIYIVNTIIGVAFTLFAVFLIAITRSYIRSRYDIPAKCCGGCEDFCCAYFCTCCSVAQMARHTADYALYNGVCCTETGLDHRAPSIV